jgi:hypothetical protein
MRITKICKIGFAINISYIDEVECEVASLDACDVMFRIPYLCERDANFYRRGNKCHFNKGG